MAEVEAAELAVEKKAPSVDFYGGSFELGFVSDITMCEWADAAEDTDAGSMHALAVIFRLLKEGIAEKDWARFMKTCRDRQAGVPELMPVVVAAFGARADLDRPTGRSTDSSGGPQATPASSESDSVNRVLTRLDGRGDLQRIVKMAPPLSA